MKPRRFYLSAGVAALAFSTSAYLMKRSLSEAPVEVPKTIALTTQAPRVPASMPASAAPLTTTAQTTRATSLPSEIERMIAEIDRVRACYERECGYPRNYPRDYEFAVGRDLKKSIYALQLVVERDQVYNEKLAQIARENLANDDGHVKEAALHLLASQPPSEENLQSILKDVVQESDAELIEHAMLELLRYKSPGDLKLIRESLAEAMLTGAPFVSEAVSKFIVQFIDSESYAFFSEIATRVSPGSRVKTNLQFSLLEYRRRNAGA